MTTTDTQTHAPAGTAGERRPIKQREETWAKDLAARLSAAGVSPNAVSLASIGFALGGGVFLLLGSAAGGWGGALLFLLVPVFIALRSLCNLLDGMIAVEHDKSSPAGIIFNELPDRVSDVILFGAAGIAAGPGGAGLGFAAGAVCVLVAYVRTLAALAGAPHDFGGPMAKPARMVVLGIACLGAAVESGSWNVAADAPVLSLQVACGLVIVGGLVTALRRTTGAIKALKPSA